MIVSALDALPHEACALWIYIVNTPLFSRLSDVVTLLASGALLLFESTAPASREPDFQGCEATGSGTV